MGSSGRNYGIFHGIMGINDDRCRGGIESDNMENDGSYGT